MDTIPHVPQVGRAGQNARLEIVPEFTGGDGRSIPWWLWGNVFSLEAPAVAVLWCVLLSRSLRIPVSWWTLAVLALTVWVIYIADHVLDARVASRPLPEPARKRYFRKHPRLTFGLLLGGLVITPVLASRCLDTRLLRFGLVGGLFVAFYLVFVQLRPVLLRRFWPREAVVSALFVWGVCLPLGTAEPSAGGRILLLAAPLFVLCWMNCCLIECLDWRRSGGRGLGQPNVVALWIERHAPACSGALLVVTILLATEMRFGREFWIALILSSLCFQLVGNLISRSRHKLQMTMSQFDWLCLVLDLALMTPLPVLLWLDGTRIWP